MNFFALHTNKMNSKVPLLFEISNLSDLSDLSDLSSASDIEESQSANYSDYSDYSNESEESNDSEEGGGRNSDFDEEDNKIHALLASLESLWIELTMLQYSTGHISVPDHWNRQLSNIIENLSTYIGKPDQLYNATFAKQVVPMVLSALELLSEFSHRFQTIQMANTWFHCALTVEKTFQWTQSSSFLFDHQVDFKRIVYLLRQSFANKYCNLPSALVQTVYNICNIHSN